MNDKFLLAMGLASALFLVRNIYVMFMVLPDEALQGAIYRIMFFHIPSWFTCFSCFLASGIASAIAISKKSYRADSWAVALTEVGMPFTLIGLVTGMIWGKISWGIWWTWDARLTWAFITLLIYSGYLMMRKMIDDPSERLRVTGVLNVFAFTSVAITYKAIDWWRTQHPGPILSIRTGGGNTDPAMEAMIYQNWFALLMLTVVLVGLRFRQEESRREIEGLRRLVFAR
ncbi:cytochrome c biogenesis protein CcsA [Bryobacter aggregatus]|uniref:cytochrome c biogenesis protein CcsA n=1 Tax=Bryobacter aggregatus TaxID=360054 RepID=UPI0004E1A09A|nr:cytochrome c biogenesis protein CcsA [Bryobacter aggregatus]